MWATVAALVWCVGLLVVHDVRQFNCFLENAGCARSQEKGIYTGVLSAGGGRVYANTTFSVYFESRGDNYPLRGGFATNAAGR